MADRIETALIGFGALGGVIAFIGCFVHFFRLLPGSLASAPPFGGSPVRPLSPSWLFLAPLFIGLATLGMFAPRRWRRIFGVFPLAGTAMALATVSWVRYDGGGVGFYMVTIGGALLTLAWMGLMIAPHPTEPATPSPSQK